MRFETRKLTRLALMATFALILSYLESRIPPLAAVPGVKVGLANIVVIFALYKMGLKEAIIVSAIRIFIVAMLFGNSMSMLYSLAGAVLSLAVMFLLKKFTPLGKVAVSVSGGVMHNVGQIAVASIVLGTNVVVYYLPFLILSGTIAGIAVGTAGAILVKRVKF